MFLWSSTHKDHNSLSQKPMPPPQLHTVPHCHRGGAAAMSPWNCMMSFPNRASLLIEIRKQDGLIIESFILKSGVCSFKRISQTLLVLWDLNNTHLLPDVSPYWHQKKQPTYQMCSATKPREVSKTVPWGTKQATPHSGLCAKKLTVNRPRF